MTSETCSFTFWFDSLNAPELNGFSKRKLEISDTVSVGGRGLVAKEDILPNECVLTLIVTDPRLLLTPNRAIRLIALCNCDVLADKFSNLETTVDPLDALTLFFYHVKSAESISSKSCLLYRLWKPYLDVLPTDFSDVSFISTASPAWFSSVISLCPSTIKAELKNQSERLRTSFLRVFPGITSDVPFEFSWAWSLVNSRCVYCKLEKDVDIGMHLLPNYFKVDDYSLTRNLRLSPHKNASVAIVPFFDFFNHSPLVSSSLDTAGGFLTLTTREAYSAGDQVFINYGPHENLFLLCEYGFVIPDNPDDAVFPSFGELVEIFSSNSDSLNHVLDELQLSFSHISEDQPLMKETRDLFWKSVYFTATEPSYFLSLILYAIASAEEDSLTRDRLFSLDESKCFSVIEPYLRTLLSFLCAQTEKAVLEVSKKFLEEDSAFIKSLICLLNCRFSILSSLLSVSTIP